MCLVNNCRNIDINPVFNENENNFDIEIDPDANCLSKISSKCEYLLDQQFTVKYKNIDGFSITHFNAQSFNANFKIIEMYLTALNYNFDAISFCETWLEHMCLMNFLWLIMVVMQYLVIKRGGGGVAIYVKKMSKTQNY